MKNKKNNIILITIISAFFLAVTYVFCLVKAYDWFDIKYLSNDFIITVFGGTFASSLVVILNEIFSYRQIKKNREDELYSNAVYFYANAIVARNTLNELLKNPQIQVVEHMIEQQKNIMLSALIRIQNIDYSTFCKKQELFMGLQKFKSKYFDYEKLINNIMYLDLAISKTRLQELEKDFKKNVQINTSFDLIAKTTFKIKIDLEEIIDACENLITIIDYSDRHNWKKNKAKIQEQYYSAFDNDLLEKYLDEN